MKLRCPALLATILLCQPAWAWNDRGGVDADGAYAVVFPLAQAEPDPRLTPGTVNPQVTQSNIHATICVPGYSKSIRPDAAYTGALKRDGIRRYGYADRRLRDYEEDHLISLEIGGSPTSPLNLWPEPHHVIGGWGSYAKDKLENRLHELVCSDRLPLREAQQAIAHDWIGAWRTYVGGDPADLDRKDPR
jgi:hypothetical protein